jgi:hypothetical protein
MRFVLPRDMTAGLVGGPSQQQVALVHLRSAKLAEPPA